MRKTIGLLAAASIFLSTGAARADDEPPVELVRSSPGLMAGGIVFISVGGLSALLGAAVILSQDSAEDSCNTASNTIVGTGGEPLDCAQDEGAIIAGATMMAGGAAFLAAGIPMTVVGARRVPAEDVAHIVITPTVGGATADLIVSF